MIKLRVFHWHTFSLQKLFKKQPQIISNSEEPGACIKACVFNLQSLTKTVILQQQKDCSSLQEEFQIQLEIF